MRVSFQNVLIGIEEADPPEEFLTTIVGSCGKWQISIGLFAFVSAFFYGLNVFPSFFLLPNNLNYTCENGNGSRCFDVDGNKCESFTFFKEYKIVTFTEKFLLVCEKDELIIWSDNLTRIGLVASYFLTALFADRFGRKLAGQIFIILYSFLGVLIITSTNYEMLLFFRLFLALCSAAMHLLPKVTLCDVVGNNFRTLALGFTILPLTISIVLLPYYVAGFRYIDEMIETTAFLPLILLLPLWFYRNSPSYILLASDVEKAENEFRKIAKFNKRLLSCDFKIRPVAVINVAIVDKSARCALWNSPQTKYPFLALLCLWLCHGFCCEFLMTYIYNDFKNLSLFGVSAVLGCIISIILCHLFVHKLVVGAFALLTRIFTLGIFIIDVYLKETNTEKVFIMKMVAMCLFWISLTALDNLTPRMFPTSLRMQSVGLCFGVFYIGSCLSTIMFYYCYKFDWVIIITFIIIPIFEIISCFWLWKVHKRELPDFLIDAIRFKKFFKPVRYLNIKETSVTPAEIEVELLDLEKQGNLSDSRIPTN